MRDRVLAEFVLGVMVGFGLVLLAIFVIAPAR